MARLAALAVLLLSLLAVASCRVLETTSDDQGPPNAVLLTPDDQSDGLAEVTLPALPTPAGENIVLSHGAPTPMLRLPSHRPTCCLHRHLWWARHHGLVRVHPAVDVVPTELARGQDQEPREAVAEPDPDARPDTGAEQKPLHGEEEEEEEAAKAWKVEMLRRFRHGIRFHHRHHEQDVEEHDGDEQDKDEGANTDLLLARFHHRRHLRRHHEQDAEEEEEDDHQQDKDEGLKTKLFRRFHHHHHHHAHDSDNEVDEVEELARKLGEAIVRRSFGHGGRRHRHHQNHHGAEGGVRNWFKGLLNRF